jgi:hypothetical protein
MSNNIEWKRTNKELAELLRILAQEIRDDEVNLYPEVDLDYIQLQLDTAADALEGKE